MDDADKEIKTFDELFEEDVDSDSSDFEFDDHQT